jgi:branched-chain amino acid transport system permease protein
LAQQLANVLVTAAVYALFALGFNLVLGALNILNLAQGAFFTLAAFVAYALSTAGMPLLEAAVIAVTCAAVLSVLLNEVSIRRLRRTSVNPLLAVVATLGASLVILNVLLQLSGAQVLRIPAGALPNLTWNVSGVFVSLPQVIALVSAVSCFLLTSALLARSRIGKAVRAIEFDERAARMIGLPTEQIVRLMFAVSGAFAGLAGVVTALLYANVSYEMGEPYLLKGFVIIVLGGFGSVGGTALASLVVAAIDIGSVAFGLSGYGDAVSFGLLVLILMVRPGGLVTARLAHRP